MPKVLPVAFRDHIQYPVTTLCTCWKINRLDGVVMGFTDHSRNLRFSDGTADGEVSYLAATGYTRSNIQNQASLAVDNLEIEGILDDVRITDEDLRAGVYDAALVTVSMVNWVHPLGGGVILKKGLLGEISLMDGRYTAEVRGLSQHLAQRFIEVYTPDCRADLGDARCTVDLSLYTDLGVVATVVGDSKRRRFTATLTPQVAGIARTAGFFLGGKLVWTSGGNRTRVGEVRNWDSETNDFMLYLPVGSEILVGDTFTVSAGCDKQKSTCKDVFNNILNMRAEPFVPGLDTLAAIPYAPPATTLPYEGGSADLGRYPSGGGGDGDGTGTSGGGYGGGGDGNTSADAGAPGGADPGDSDPGGDGDSGPGGSSGTGGTGEV
jgi:uncharacterized phage protein (TIGR02218 family)